MDGQDHISAILCWEPYSRSSIRWPCPTDFQFHIVSAKVNDESGISRLVSNQELMDEQADPIELWRRYEARIFEIVKVVWSMHNTSRKISDSAELNIYVTEIHEPSKWIEQ